jgi:hypothetical protein
VIPEREHLQTPDDERVTHTEVVAGTTGRSSIGPSEHDAEDDERHGNGDGAAEAIGNDVSQHESGETGRNRGENDEPRTTCDGILHGTRRCDDGSHSRTRERHEIAAHRDDDGSERTDVERGIERRRIGFGGERLPVEQPRNECEVSARRHGQELGETLHDAQHEGFEHGEHRRLRYRSASRHR